MLLTQSAESHCIIIFDERESAGLVFFSSTTQGNESSLHFSPMKDVQGIQMGCRHPQYALKDVRVGQNGGPSVVTPTFPNTNHRTIPLAGEAELMPLGVSVNASTRSTQVTQDGAPFTTSTSHAGTAVPAPCVRHSLGLAVWRHLVGREAQGITWATATPSKGYS